MQRSFLVSLEVRRLQMRLVSFLIAVDLHYPDGAGALFLLHWEDADNAAFLGDRFGTDLGGGRQIILQILLVNFYFRDTDQKRLFAFTSCCW